MQLMSNKYYHLHLPVMYCFDKIQNQKNKVIAILHVICYWIFPTRTRWNSSRKASFKISPQQISYKNLTLVSSSTSNLMNRKNFSQSLWICFHKVPYSSTISPLTTLVHHPPHIVLYFFSTTLLHNLNHFPKRALKTSQILFNTMAFTKSCHNLSMRWSTSTSRHVWNSAFDQGNYISLWEIKLFPSCQSLVHLLQNGVLDGLCFEFGTQRKT